MDEWVVRIVHAALDLAMAMRMKMTQKTALFLRVFTRTSDDLPRQARDEHALKLKEKERKGKERMKKGVFLFCSVV